MKLFFAGLMIFALTTFITSCTDESSITDDATVENYVDQSVDYLHAEGNCGRFGCYEFVFPITIDFPDGSTVTVEDYAGLRSELKAWFTENGENIDWPMPSDSMTYADIPFDQLPSLAYPLEIMTDGGDVITVNDREELHQLRQECRRDFLRHLRRHFRRAHRDICFKLVYPVSVEFPDGSILNAATPQALKAALREWKQNNPNPNNRPHLVFPLTIEFDDGSTIEVASKEALMAIKDSCGEG